MEPRPYVGGDDARFVSPAADKKGEKGEKGALPPVGTIGPQQFVIKLKQENVMFEVRQPLVRKYPGSQAIPAILYVDAP